MRIFKWSPTFSPKKESAVVPVWIGFPELPAHLFDKSAIYSIASLIGNPLNLDDFTAFRSKLSCARVCVEIDLTKPRVDEIGLGIKGVEIVQKVIYENVPKYCSLCFHLGHAENECYTKGNAPRPQGKKRGRFNDNNNKGKEKIFSVESGAERDALEIETNAQETEATSKNWEEKITAHLGTHCAEGRHQEGNAEDCRISALTDKFQRKDQTETENEIEKGMCPNEDFSHRVDVQIKNKQNWIQVGNAFMILNEDVEIQEGPEKEKDSHGEEIEGMESSKETEINQIVVALMPSKQECLKIQDPICSVNQNPRDTGVHFHMPTETDNESVSSDIGNMFQHKDKNLRPLGEEVKQNALHRRAKSSGSKAPLFQLNHSASKRIKTVNKIISRRMPKSALDSSSSHST